MPIRTDIQSNFLNLFTKVFENEALENGNKLNVFMLKISNNQFNYSGLNEELENADLTIVVLNNNEELSDYDKENLKEFYKNEFHDYQPPLKSVYAKLRVRLTTIRFYSCRHVRRTIIFQKTIKKA